MDLDAIRANWDKVKAQTPLQIVEKHIAFHQKNGADLRLIEALNLLWSDINFIHNGGHLRMMEKK